MNDVNLRVAADGGFTDSAFADVAAARLEEADELANFESCHYASVSGRLRLDGYAFDGADDSLRVLLAHRVSEEPMRTLTQTESKVLFAKLIALVRGALDGTLEQSVDENHPLRDFMDSVREKRSSISRIRAYLVTDLILSARVKDWPEGEVGGIPVDFHIWDIGRFYRAQVSATGLDELIVEFTNSDIQGIPFLKASMPGSPYASYLCVVPGPLLAKIYDTYGSRLLEGNVRAFLSTKGKINQGIRKTLLETPEMFFAYNNGVSCVASEVTIRETSSGPMLMSALNLQIVNGGQTTASVSNVERVDKAPRLGETFIPMKLSVVGGEQSTAMISDISRYANSQNKVSDADFFANHPFHQRLEQISRRLLAPAQAGMQYETHWYYERARGQYLNEFAKLSTAERERFKRLCPKQQIITKTDLAKSELSWQGRPNTVSQGAQSFFLEFAKRIDAAWVADQNAFHEEYYRNIVARIIICRAAEHLVSRQPWYYSGYRSIVVSYSIARLALAVSGIRGYGIDLRRIWRNQQTYSELEGCIVGIAATVFEALGDLPDNQKNLTQWAKRQTCWDRIQHVPVSLGDEFLQTLVPTSDLTTEVRAARAMQMVDSGIDQQSAVIALGQEFWGRALAWAVLRGALAPPDRQALSAAAGQKGSIPTEKQSKRLLELKKRFEDAGFSGSAPQEWLGVRIK
jgi:hypothetical protein